MENGASEVPDEDYEKGLDALSGLISGRVRADGKNWSHAFEMMKVYLERLQLENELPKLSIIHIAGTKGKGSTCAMVESILRHAGYKTGLYTSPHLIDVRERIRINGAPVDKATFLRHLWAAFAALDATANEDSGKPAYFRFLTLLGFRIFLESAVDVTVLEVGLGGRLDATNCVREPVVCGVTPLGFDHMDLLGHTLPEIAREKAGIFKPGAPAFTVNQREDAAAALEEVAGRVGAPLAGVPSLESYRSEGGSASDVAELRLGLAGAHQRQNAALALALAAEWEARSGRGGADGARRAKMVREGVLPREYAAGLQMAQWPGRGQIVEDHSAACDSGLASPPRLTLYLDGAHTAESMATCGEWYADEATASAAAAAAVPGMHTQRVLVFNCMQERDPTALLQPLASTLAARGVMPTHALFVPTDSTYTKLGQTDEPPDLSWQLNLRRVWAQLEAQHAQHGNAAAPSAAAASPLRPVPLPALPLVASLGAQEAGAAGAVLPNLRATLDWLRRCVALRPSVRMQVLVTGSLYLVGDLLKILRDEKG